MLVEICSQLPINRCGGKDPYDPIREDLRNFLLKLREQRLSSILIPSWMEGSITSSQVEEMLLNFHRKSGLKNFSKNRPVVSCKSRESWKTKLFCQWNGAWSNILWRDRFPVATADKPVPTFGESLCLSWFFLGPQWSIKNRHVAAVFCIFAWNHQSHFAVNTAVVFPRSRPVKSLMKATAFF